MKEGVELLLHNEAADCFSWNQLQILFQLWYNALHAMLNHNTGPEWW